MPDTFRTLTLVHAAQRWAGHLPAGRRLSAEDELWQAVIGGAAADPFTGSVLGPRFEDEAGTGWRQVSQFERDQETDRFVTKAGVRL